MGIDASIYQNAQPNPVQIPDPMDAATKALQYGTLQMQQAQMKRQQMLYAANQNAYLANTDPNTGQVDQNGVISTFNKMGLPQLASSAADQFAATAKAQGDAAQAKMKAADDAASKVYPMFKALAAAPVSEEWRSKMYPIYAQDLQDQGVDMSKLGTTYDPDTFQQHWSAIQAHMPAVQQFLANNATAATTAQTQENTAATAAKLPYEIGKLQAETGDMLDKRVQSLKDDLDPAKARGGNMAKSYSVVLASQRLNAIFQQFPDYNIPKAQGEEVASGYAALINGGSAQSQAQINGLIPQSLVGNAKGIASWVTNQPLGASQQRFMKMLQDSINREGALADTQVKTSQVQRAGSHLLLKQTNPNAFWGQLHDYGIEPADIINGKYAPSGADSVSTSAAAPTTAAPAASSQSRDSQALQALSTLDPSSPKAFQLRAILKAKGLLK